MNKTTMGAIIVAENIAGSLVSEVGPLYLVPSLIYGGIGALGGYLYHKKPVEGALISTTTSLLVEVARTIMVKRKSSNLSKNKDGSLMI